MKKEWLVKTLALGVVVLFVDISVSPDIYAMDEEHPKIETNPIDNKIIKFKVTEFKSDETNESTIIEMTFEKAKKLKTDLKKAKCAEDKLQVYKDYDFIPENVTLEKMKQGMKEKAQKNDLTEEKLWEISEKFSLMPLFNYRLRNIKCSVAGGMSAGFRVILGLSAISRFINWYLFKSLGLDLGEDIPSFDISINLCGLFGSIIAQDGLLPDIFFIGTGIIFMLGFVGYYVTTIKVPIALLPIFLYQDVFLGYASYLGVAGWF